MEVLRTMFQCHEPHQDGAAFTSSISLESTYHGKRSKKVLTSISMLGLLASCTEGGTLEARNDNVSMATQSIRTSVDDDELGR
jgi:hypothetical protein